MELKNMKILGLLAAFILFLAIPINAIEPVKFSLTAADKQWLEGVNSDIKPIISDLQAWHEIFDKTFNQEAKTEDETKHVEEFIKYTQILNGHSLKSSTRSDKINVSDRLSTIETEYINAVRSIAAGSGFILIDLKPGGSEDHDLFYSGVDLISKGESQIKHVNEILDQKTY
jgi:hypothetical protein